MKIPRPLYQCPLTSMSYDHEEWFQFRPSGSRVESQIHAGYKKYGSKTSQITSRSTHTIKLSLCGTQVLHSPLSMNMTGERTVPQSHTRILNPLMSLFSSGLSWKHYSCPTVSSSRRLGCRICGKLSSFGRLEVKLILHDFTYREI